MKGLERLPAEHQARFEKFCRGFGPIGYSEDHLVDLVLARVPASSPGDLSAYFHAWCSAYREDLPPLCAVHAGARLPFGLYDVVDFLASSSETVAEGFERVARYFALIRPGVEYVLDATSHHPTVTLVDSLHDDDYFFDEWTIGVILGRFREQLAERFRYVACTFRRPKPPRESIIEEATALLGCEPTFAARSASISFARDVWEAILPSRNSRLCDTLERHARELIEEQAGVTDTTRRVRETLVTELRGGDPTIERVAKKLAVTPRTLQRRLQDEGTSFQAVLDTIRAELARRYLTDNRLGVSEVAFLLGYADASAFARAFRRWYGKAPAESRRPGLAS